MSEAEISVIGHCAPTVQRRFMDASHSMSLNGGREIPAQCLASGIYAF